MNNENKILIVDDEKINRDILVALLKPFYSIMVAKNGEQALKAASRENGKPDLILLDIQMPEMDGYEVCQRLQSNPDTSNIPVIFVTALGSIEEESKGFEMGAVDYIIKPISYPVIRARIKTQLQLKHKTDLLEKYGVIDDLTRIPDRRAFDNALDDEWKRAIRFFTPLTVVLMKIDHFTAYKNLNGSAAGDNCLKQVAIKLSAIATRPGDTVAHFGDGEFCAILPNTKLDGVKMLAEKFRSTVEEMQMEHGDSAVGPHITITVGVATSIPEQEISSQSLLDTAQENLNQGKEYGCNVAVC